MDEFSKYFKSMLEQLMKSGGGEMNFDVKGFDLNSGSPLMQMFFGGVAADKKEKLAVRKLSDEEMQQYKDIEDKKAELQSQFRRLMNLQKKMEADVELFWQDMIDSSHIKADIKQLSIDMDSGFLFQEVNVNIKDQDKEEK